MYLRLTADEIDDRVIEHAAMVIDTKKTVREISNETGWSKTTVDIDVTTRLERLDKGLAEEVRVILDEHYKERGQRGQRGWKAAKAAQKKTV